jgi:hypothetical protein
MAIVGSAARAAKPMRNVAVVATALIRMSASPAVMYADFRQNRA